MKSPHSQFHFVFLLCSAAAILSGGCSSSSDDSGGDGDGDGAPSTFLYCEPADTCPPSIDKVKLDTEISFRKDIYEGYFRYSCGEGSGCHGTQATGGLIFGKATAPLDDTEISELIATLKGKPAVAAPDELNVVAGDWSKSFLMKKLDGCQNDSGLRCDSDAIELSTCGDKDSGGFLIPLACGDGMPAREDVPDDIGGDNPENAMPFATSAAERLQVHKVREWIEQGALDN